MNPPPLCNAYIEGTRQAAELIDQAARDGVSLKQLFLSTLQAQPLQNDVQWMVLLTHYCHQLASEADPLSAQKELARIGQQVQQLLNRGLLALP